MRDDVINAWASTADFSVWYLVIEKKDSVVAAPNCNWAELKCLPDGGHVGVIERFTYPVSPDAEIGVEITLLTARFALGSS